MTVDIQAHSRGALLPVKAQPGSRRNEVRGEQDGALKVSVTQIPEKGKANKAIADFLAKTLKLRKSQVLLLAGETSSQKTFLIEEITPESLQERIAPFL